MKGGLLVAGTTSDAGKSVVTAGICRWLARRGVRVAPFKAQNMSLNSYVTADGAEIGRAQAVQAAACGLEPTADMNPILLKPGSDRRSQIVVRGRPVADVDAMEYGARRDELRAVAVESYRRLAAEFDVVVCEGAGSPAEINLRAGDIANMGLARAAGLPVVVVGDIDRGGVFAHLYGTVALLDAADQAHVAGFVVNKFRGARELLAPGLDMIEGLTGRRVYGVLPWLDGLWMDVEDSLSLDTRPLDTQALDTRARGAAAAGGALRVTVVRYPRISNFTDVDALAAEPGVVVTFATSPAECADADLLVLPGSRATVGDLAWLRETGIADLVARRTGPVLGICGGYQMLARTITDEVESGAGTVAGLGSLPADVVFAAEKTLGRPSGEAYGHPVEAYEIHHGIVTRDGGEEFLDGCRAGNVWGTTWHGALENDGFRRAFLAEVARAAGREFHADPGLSFAALREARLDALGDLVERNADTGALLQLIEAGPPSGLRILPPGAV
ncbi:cobyric acid synthase [Microbispora sp. NBC_01189]|uniref:cobyric acid synthase n=1 Tax=Microbispora sp. NBC_01189 TaxID=2903583 RepID=UPI002E126076|nr:cobyric acid synthase [Microbispora sp. NBC_01189]